MVRDGDQGSCCKRGAKWGGEGRSERGRKGPWGRELKRRKKEKNKKKKNG